MNNEAMSNEPIRVLLADDHPAVRAGIRGPLEKAP
nr:response regulator transcription factor [Anaerolineae bacterium]